jgi:hypothetical protein
MEVDGVAEAGLERFGRSAGEVQERREGTGREGCCVVTSDQEFEP